MDTRKTILIADDSEINRELLSNFFGEQYHVLPAEDGEQVLQLLTQCAGEITLVLLDLMMPKKSGFEVLEFMREQKLDGRIPVIVITGSNDFEDEIQAYNLGASDIIHKPFRPQIVLRRAEYAIELFERRTDLEQQLENRTKALDDVQNYDTVTGLYNMQHFLEEANQLLRAADEDGSFEEYYFIYNNIRNFKIHNLNYGREAGDRVLKTLADKLREMDQEKYTYARFGSDHLVSMVRRTDVMDRVQEFCKFFEKEYGKTGMTLKIGIYRVTEPGEVASAACDLAKIACDSIRSSKESVCIYNDTISKKMNISTYVLKHFEEALENGYIKVYYQPVIRTLTGDLCGMEALARWIDPVMGFLSPADFIPVLEDSNLISKLDLHMLRLICKEMKQAEAKKMTMIPVSFNLSRMDFMEGDIFGEIEKIVREYGVARDLINIEITESIVMEKPEYMRKVIRSIRSAGYQVWMDDFGSGYSSLNVLKDYEFDEIKLDMKFLSSFDENSKKIIESVILMAKKLGIQTLAEGVETQEQYEYLRSIGCEKGQGYLFSKPLPAETLYENCVKNDTKVESRGQKGYYNRIGAVNFITERPLAIVEYYDGRFEFLFDNPAFQEGWKSLGITDKKTVYDSINSVTSPLHRSFMDLKNSCHIGEQPQEIVYSIRGQYVRMSVSCLAETEERVAFDVEITSLTSREADSKWEKLDNVFRMMYALYDSVYLLDMNTGEFEALMKGTTGNVKESRSLHENRKIDTLASAGVFIHPSEQQEYLKFVDASTIIERLKKAERGYLTEYFRTKTGNGSYVWKAHTLLYVVESNSIIYCSRSAYFAQPGLIERIAPEYLIDTIAKEKAGYYPALRQGIMESQTVNVFWKDSNRRFLGANAKFLSTYGFSDASAIIGKTDEDMGWHVDAEPFEDDEWRVLKNGEVIRNRAGKCIIKGVEHNIMVCKEPLFQDGKIVGLVGMFFDVDKINEEIGITTGIGITDQITGLLSTSGMTNTVAEYLEGWTARGENFAIIRITISEYYRAGQTYGKRIARAMLHESRQIVAEFFGIHGACGRLFAGNFVALMKCQDKEAIISLADQIRQRLEETHSLAGYPVTIHPGIDVCFADETENTQTLIERATGGAVVNVAENKQLED